ncbi:gamma-glutamylcyclotransferase family protein [Rhodoferax aquaticus]|uniref:Gamma-glutamylcyclotransferase n=1 Tax=Rhodoferax aquaticus TaxID=2527691 RepID=A0A515EJW9_9BURK|nr:gamma-glutamylcyclotransferase family protein [Rhodoferax aquaticus]QDL52940.1 gamma-glutamylcyclotransferase [Rhodoferax aquaticus]
MLNHLFVYGTLAPGRPNEHVLADIPGTWESGTVRGTLLQEGWGAKVGYPGIVLDHNGGEVQGFLFSSDKLAAHLPRLDAFEGSGYERVETKVHLDRGLVDAYIYVLSQSSAQT